MLDALTGVLIGIFIGSKITHAVDKTHQKSRDHFRNETHREMLLEQATRSFSEGVQAVREDLQTPAYSLN